MSKWLILILVILAVGAAVLATRDGPSPGSPEQQVRELAQARIDAIANGDFRTAHAQLSPAYRALVDSATYRARLTAMLEWHGGEIRSVTCEEPDVCLVTWLADQTMITPGGQFAPIRLPQVYEDRWLLLDGQWWHVPSR